MGVSYTITNIIYSSTYPYITTRDSDGKKFKFKYDTINHNGVIKFRSKNS